MRLRLGVCSSSNSQPRDGSPIWQPGKGSKENAGEEMRAEMWTQESEKKVVRTRISNEATDNSQPVPPSAVPTVLIIPTVCHSLSRGPDHLPKNFSSLPLLSP